MTLAAFCILMFECILVKKLFAKYLRKDEDDIEVIEFVSRANLEDIIHMRYHMNNIWLALGIMSIGSIVKL